MIRIEKAVFTDEVVARLIELSKVWEAEQCTFGLEPNEREDLREPCFLAYDGDLIVGYVFGHFYEEEAKHAFSHKGDRMFDVDELYVIREYRSQGVGKMLFEAMEKEVGDQVDAITLATPTKDWHRILKFYIEEMGMTFYNAFLFKKTR